MKKLKENLFAIADLKDKGGISEDWYKYVVLGLLAKFQDDMSTKQIDHLVDVILNDEIFEDYEEPIMNFLFNQKEDTLKLKIGDIHIEYAQNPCIGRTEYRIKEISENEDVYGEQIFSNVRDLEISDVE